MTNKLVVIINCLKVPKIEKLLLYEMKFLAPNYSCLQNPWLGYRPQIPVLWPLSSTEFVEPPRPSPNKIPGYATAVGNCNTMESIIIYNNIIILWDHRRICGPSLTETLCGAYPHLSKPQPWFLCAASRARKHKCVVVKNQGLTPQLRRQTSGHTTAPTKT